MDAACGPRAGYSDRKGEMIPILTWKETNRAAFAACVGPLLAEPMVRQLSLYHQHNAMTTRLDHCIAVAYFSFLICRRLGWDYRAAARGGLLHDLYLDRWPGSESGALARWRTHPAAAMHNARVYGLTRKEEDIIVQHKMFAYLNSLIWSAMNIASKVYHLFPFFHVWVYYIMFFI